MSTQAPADAHDVAVVHLPRDRDRLAELRRRDVPRLLVLEEGTPPPPDGSCLEDFVRPSTEADEVTDRLNALRARARHHHARPTVDHAGVLRYREGFIPLSEVERPLVRLLLDHEGEVVDREALRQAGWPDDEPSENLLDVHIMRLRKRLEPIGVRILTARGRGYAMTTV